MSSQGFIALASLCVTLILTLMGATWKFASIATVLGEESKQLRERIAKLDEGLESLTCIPLLIQRIEQLERIAMMIPDIRTELRITQRDIQSLRPPRQGSMHDE